jgi:hypothetical protein
MEALHPYFSAAFQNEWHRRNMFRVDVSQFCSALQSMLGRIMKDAGKTLMRCCVCTVEEMLMSTGY